MTSSRGPVDSALEPAQALLLHACTQVAACLLKQVTCLSAQPRAFGAATGAQRLENASQAAG